MSKKQIIFFRILSVILNTTALYLIFRIIDKFVYGGIKINIIHIIIAAFMIVFFVFLSFVIVKDSSTEERSIDKKKEKFDKEVDKIKKELSKNKEVKVKIRDTTELEFADFVCLAKLNENGDIECKIEIPSQIITFDSYEEFANYFSLEKKEK